MLERLQRETASHHHGADEDQLSIVSAAATAARYADYLVRIHGFEAGFDVAVGDTAAPFDVRQRVQITAIQDDLRALGVVDAPTLAGPHVMRAPEALGWLYVVERARRLHGLIERHLRSRLPSALAGADAYLTRTRTTGKRWRELGEAMDEIVITPRHAQRVVDAARLAFRCRRAWHAGALRSAPRLVA
jgi:heme oxygenase